MRVHDNTSRDLSAHAIPLGSRVEPPAIRSNARGSWQNNRMVVLVFFVFGTVATENTHIRHTHHVTHNS